MARLEDRIQAIRWKLGLPGSGENPTELKRIWEDLQRNHPEFMLVTKQVSDRLGHILAASIRAKLTGIQSENYDWASELADLFVKWAKDNERMVWPKLAGLLRVTLDEKALAQQPNAPAPVRAAPPASPPPVGPKPQGLHPKAGVPYPGVRLAPPPLGIPPQGSQPAARPEITSPPISDILVVGLPSPPQNTNVLP